MPQRGNDSSSTLKEVLFHPVGKRRHRVVEKPAKCNGSIKDKTIQVRPSSISSFTSTLRLSLTRFRIVSISRKTSRKLVSGAAGTRKTCTFPPRGNANLLPPPAPVHPFR